MMQESRISRIRGANQIGGGCRREWMALKQGDTVSGEQTAIEEA